MIDRKQIQEFVDRVVRQFSPRQVILFGSHAYGQPSTDSDVDLLLVMPYRGPSARAATRVRLACPRSFSLDLLVRTPQEIQSRLRVGDPFIGEVMSKGIVLHEKHNARMGR